MKEKRELDADPIWLWWTPMIILLVLFLHELGHALGGWLVNFRLHLLAAGPLRWDRKPEGGGRFSFNRSLSLWGGVAASTADPALAPGLEDLAKRMLVMVAGGPLVSLVSAVAGLGLGWLLVEGPARLLLLLFGFTSLTIGAATLVPMSTGGFKSDGQRILELLRGGREAERFVANATLGSLAISLRPREWPREIVETATGVSDDSFDGIAATWMRHSWHLDRREIGEAREWLEKALARAESWPEAGRPMIYSSAAYFYAIEAPDVAKAREYSSRTQKAGFLPTEGKILVEAAMAALAGESTKAQEAARRGKEMAVKHPGSAGEAMRETFEFIEARAGQ
jgi:hypothetical protein